MVSIGRHPNWIPIGVHSPHSARLGHPSRLKIGTLARPLLAFNCSEEVFAMDILAESRLTFRQGLIITYTDGTLERSVPLRVFVLLEIYCVIKH